MPNMGALWDSSGRIKQTYAVALTRRYKTFSDLYLRQPAPLIWHFIRPSAPSHSVWFDAFQNMLYAAALPVYRTYGTRRLLPTGAERRAAAGHPANNWRCGRGVTLYAWRG